MARHGGRLHALAHSDAQQYAMYTHEARAMASNVFAVNPENVVVDAGFSRIRAAIRAEGLQVGPVDWSEPNPLLESFRCATIPLVRSCRSGQKPRDCKVWNRRFAALPEGKVN